MDVLAIISLIGSLLGVIVSATVVITFFKTIKREVKKSAEEDTTRAVNQQYMMNDLKEIKVQLTVLNQKSDTTFQMAVRQEERQNQTEKRLDNLDAKIEQAFMFVNRTGGIKQ